MRKVLVVAGLAAATATYAQSTTDCHTVGSSVSCTTNNSAEDQAATFEAARNLGAIFAARRERKRQERAAEAVRVRQEAVEAAMKRAVDSDNAPVGPLPTDEKPILLICKFGDAPGTIALYEKHNRADVTSRGVTHTRLATFTLEAVTWTSPLFRSSLSRVDGSYTVYGNIPELAGRSESTTCKLATERAF